VGSERFEEVEVGRVEVIKAVEKALLVRSGVDEVWIPRSQICGSSEIAEEGEEGLLVLPKWLADKEF
jgi:hypothetical protein